jgi:hypothetical protein
MSTAVQEAPSPVAPQVRQTRRFFIAVGVFMTLIVVVGFWRSYFGPLIRGTIDQPLLIHVHAAVFMGWIALFITQVTLAAKGRLRWHQKVGTIGMWYGVVLVAVGLLTGVIRSADRVIAGGNAAQLLYVASLDMALFAPFFAAAVFYRRRPQLHKRLMLVAATILLVAAVARFPFYPAGPLRIHLRMMLWSVPILAAIAYDFRNKLGLHAVYICGLAGLAFRNYSVALSQTDGWLAVTDWVTGWVL